MTRDIQTVNDDIVEMKRFIKQKLISDVDILEVLHNPSIDIDCPDDFLDTNIFDYLRIPQTQDTVRNFLCFTVDDIEDNRYNEVIKLQYIRVTVICHLDDMKTPYGISRHDLLGYLVKDVFNWTNDYGLQFKLISNEEKTFDSDYYGRALCFSASKVNSLNKARMNNPNDYRRR